MVIVSFTKNDWPAVASIYEEGIATGHATFETCAPSWNDWDKGHLPFGRLKYEEQTILGWAALTHTSKRTVYKGVAEVSVYVKQASRNKGVGSKLLEALITASEEHGIWTLQASIFPQNEASVHLHQKHGFRIVGIRERIGQLNGVWFDNLLLERRSLTIV